MKKILLALLCIATFSSCSFINVFKYSEEINEGADDMFASYPGMNVNEDPLEGIEFILPDGVEISQIIYGEANQRDEENQDEGLTITEDMLGSGLCVIVTLEIENNNPEGLVLTLPAGLMIQSASGAYQNGILVKDVDIALAANKTRKVSVRFYCLNAALSASDNVSKYNLSYITNVSAFQPLFNVCATKRININEYKPINILKYYSTATLVQEIVWAITKGKAFTEAEIQKYLKKVKNAD